MQIDVRVPLVVAVVVLVETDDRVWQMAGRSWSWWKLKVSRSVSWFGMRPWRMKGRRWKGVRAPPAPRAGVGITSMPPSE